MSFQIHLLSDSGPAKIFLIPGTYFQLGGAPNAAVSLSGLGLPDVVIQFQVTDEGCQGTCRVQNMVTHNGTIILERQSFLWKTGEELHVGQNRFVLVSLQPGGSVPPPLHARPPVSTPSSPSVPASASVPSPSPPPLSVPPPLRITPPPITPPVPLKMETVSSVKKKAAPEESKTTLYILLGALGGIVVMFLFLLVAFGLEQKQVSESYSFKQIYVIAESEKMPQSFMRTLSEANLNETRNPRHALENYVHLQQDLIEEMKNQHPSTYGGKGKILNFLNQCIGRMKRKTQPPKR